MKNLIVFLLLQIIFSSCNPIFIENSTIEFIVINQSKEVIELVKVYLVDNQETNLNVQKLDEALNFQSLESKTQSNIRKINIKDFSALGRGQIKVFVSITGNRRDSLKTGAGNYYDFKYFNEFAPKNWKTIEIVISDSESSNKLELFARVSLYENGILKKRF